MNLLRRLGAVVLGLFLLAAFCFYMQLGLDLTTQRGSPIYGLAYWLAWLGAPIVAAICFHIAIRT